MMIRQVPFGAQKISQEHRFNHNVHGTALAVETKWPKPPFTPGSDVSLSVSKQPQPDLLAIDQTVILAAR